MSSKRLHHHWHYCVVYYYHPILICSDYIIIYDYPINFWDFSNVLAFAFFTKKFIVTNEEFLDFIIHIGFIGCDLWVVFSFWKILLHKSHLFTRKAIQRIFITWIIKCSWYHPYFLQVIILNIQLLNLLVNQIVFLGLHHFPWVINVMCLVLNKEEDYLIIVV